MRRLAWVALCVVSVAFALPGCESSSDRLAALAARAASPTGGRAAVAPQMAQMIKAGQISYDEALTAAFEAVETAEKDQTGAGSAAATAFAGSVLDAITLNKDGMLAGVEFELFWMRVGGLAFKAGEEAANRGRLPEARSLVLAGSDRWQNEFYWSKRPDHDALASAVMAAVGEKTEAIRRLENRPDLESPAKELLDTLKRGK